MGMKHVAPVGVLLAATTFLGAPAHAGSLVAPAGAKPGVPGTSRSAAPGWVIGASSPPRA